MALNKVDVSGGRITLHGDYIIHHQEKIDFSLEGDRLPSNMKGTHNGDMFISNLRLIFTNSKTSTSGYRSFSMDFQHIRNTEVKQPVFGCNYIKGFVIAEPNGGWEGNANFSISFPKGGAIEFAEKFQRAVKESLRNRQAGVTPQPPQNPVGFYPPPQMGYPPMQMGAPPPMGGAPPMAGGYYYPPPPQESLYVYQSGVGPPQGQPSYSHPTGQAPPPYNANDYPNPNNINSQTNEAGNAKAHEAYMSGNTAFVPNEAPPPYNPNYDAKKDQ